MKKIALFTCDIDGTITTYAEGEELKNYYERLFDLLEKIRIKSKADELIFSHSTGDDSIDYLFFYVNQFNSFLNNKKIILGNQFMCKGCYDENKNLLFKIDGLYKAQEIKKYVKLLQESNEVVWVGFADDMIGERSIAELIYDLKNVPEIYGFIPGKENITSDIVSSSNKPTIDGLLDAIDMYLNPEIIKFDEKDDCLKKVEENRKQRAILEKIDDEHKEFIRKEQELKESKRIEELNYYAKKDNYTYLAETHDCKLDRNIIDEKDVNLLASLYQAFESDQSNYTFVNSKITRDSVYQLKLLENKYATLMHLKDSDFSKMVQYSTFSKAITYLLFDLYSNGYMHKYSEDVVDEVLTKSSLLAIDMAIYPNEKYIVRPNYKFYRLCPFHTEMTPSFLIYNGIKEKGEMSSYKCYGCGDYGSIISYLKTTKELSFVPSIETLAASFDISLPERSKTSIDKVLVEKTKQVLESEKYKELMSISEEKTEVEKTKFLQRNKLGLLNLNRL